MSRPPPRRSYSRLGTARAGRWPAVAVAALAAAALIATGAGGCGGSASQQASADQESGGGEAQSEERERAEAAKQVPAADRVAYYQLATTAGLLRGRAAAAAQGVSRPAPVGRTALADARKRVVAARPRDPGLERVRSNVLSLLGVERRGDFRIAEARLILRRLDAVHAALERYVRRRAPATASLLPD